MRRRRRPTGRRAPPTRLIGGGTQGTVGDLLRDEQHAIFRIKTAGNEESDEDVVVPRDFDERNPKPTNW